MKSPLIIWVSALALFTLSATLFAQTATGSSLITQMKAATHSFTLSGDLNSGATDLESSPLVGKKTGDMLSAGEYNRLLELVGQGGGGGAGWLKICAWNDTACQTNGMIGMKCEVTLSTYGGKFENPNQWHYSGVAMKVISGRWYGSFPNISASSGNFADVACDRVVVFDPSASGAAPSGGGTGWIDEALTGTGNFDRNAQYRFFLKAKDPTYVPQNYTYYADLVTDTNINMGTVCGNIAIYSATKNTFSQFDWNQGGCGTVTPARYTVEKIQKSAGGSGGWFNWDQCTPEWVNTPRNGTPYTNAAGLLCKYTGASGPAALDSTYYLCCPGA